MTDICGKSTVKARYSGQGLSDTLRREKVEAKRAKRKAKEERRQARAVDETQDVARPEDVSAEQGGPAHNTEAFVDPGPVSGETHHEMISRLYRAFAGQMDQLDARLKELLPDSSGGMAEIDRTVKTLASLAKTLTVLMDLKEGETDDAEESGLDDPEELRAELAQRLERLCESRAD
ncbi:MAG: hypothetical protein ABJQ71_22055 [Roseibium sp.]